MFDGLVGWKGRKGSGFSCEVVVRLTGLTLRSACLKLDLVRKQGGGNAEANSPKKRKPNPQASMLDIKKGKG